MTDKEQKQHQAKHDCQSIMRNFKVYANKDT